LDNRGGNPERRAAAIAVGDANRFLTSRHISTTLKPKERQMELAYTFWKDDGWYVGHMDDYPDYTTQGETLAELEEMLRSLYDDIKTYDFSFIHYHGKIEIPQPALS
jgi:hypothetical protein